MSGNKENINKPIKGMNRDTAKYNLQGDSYTFAYNSNVESLNGEGPLQHTNEHSNLLCSNFKEGYKVVGHFNDYNSDKTYFFITNKETGLSEIGEISSISTFMDIKDLESECGCEITVNLNEPLENQNQSQICNYTTLITDCDGNSCLNFDVDFPIQSIEMIYEDNDRVLYFTDNKNPVRKINLDDLDSYYYLGEVSDCEEDVSTCLDCEKLLVFPHFEKPCLKASSVILGGNLNAGSYEFLVAYCSSTGDEISNYYSITNPVYIYNLNNNILVQPELDYRTNLAIKLEVENLDDSFSHFKIVSLQKEALNQQSSFFEVGVYPIDSNVVIYSTDDNKIRIPLASILQKRISYTKAKGLTSSDDRLFQYGLTKQKELNLQPVVNLMGAFAKWSTNVAKEDLYTNPILTSETKGYMRDEVYPFGIKFFTKQGYETPLFPLIHRPAIEGERDTVDLNNKEIRSINSYGVNCNEIGRTEHWQYYNTATVDPDKCTTPGSAGSNDVNIVETRKCTVKEAGEIKVVDSISSGNLILEGNIEVNDLENYINGGGEFTGGLSNSALQNILSNSYPSDICNPFEGESCSQPVEESTEIRVLDVENFTSNVQEKIFPLEYDRLIKPSSCDRVSSLLPDIDKVDFDFIDNYMLGTETVNKISAPLSNINCTNKETLPLITDPNVSPSSNFYFDNIGALSLSGVLDSTKTISDSSDINSIFLNNVHKGSLFFEVDFNGKQEIIFEVSESSDCSETDDNAIATQLRFSTFNSCNSNTSVESSIFNVNQGFITTLQRVNYASDKVLVILESPFRFRNIITNNSGGNSVDVYTITPPCSCVHVVQRDIEIARTIFTFSLLTFYKIGEYSSSCSYTLPELGNCNSIPYEKGNFSFWESESKYPCNNDLFNSQLLDKIDSNTIPESIRQDFEKYYVDSIDVNNNYVLNDNANFTDKPIRHFKFPCNSIAPFMDSQFKVDSGRTFIFPIGFSLSEEVISYFLDVAVENDIIDAKTRNDIDSYEIYRGDRRINKSVLSKGIAFDMYSYKDEINQTKWYPNFPYNSLGKDVLHNNEHPQDSLGNNNYTYHSPDTHIRSSDIGSEIKIEGYVYGNSLGRFAPVDSHPEWVIMGQPAYDLANTLAGLQIAFETAQFVGDISTKGAAGGVSAGVSVAAAAAAVISYGAAATYRAGEYRYEWLEIFRNLATIQNYAYFYTSHGEYTYFKPNKEVNSIIRGIGTGKYIKSGDLRVNQEFNNSTIDINNLDRERSVYLGLGDFSVDYPTEYINYDNFTSNEFNASRTISSKDLISCSEGISTENRKHIASPLFSVKNYFPDQYGEINSIQWLSTGKCGKFDDLNNDCNTFFGGDIFISRFSLKRKIPLFSVNAMDQADLTPFSYSRYKNITTLQYYVDYEVNEDGASFSSVVFPDKRTRIDNMDCQKDEFYIKPSTKFYLFYYGIPNFLIESEINCNLRHGKPQPKDNFYPNTTDYVKFTQEDNVSIREPNTFFYNEVYSSAKSLMGVDKLPINFSNSDSEKNTFVNNSVIYSSSNGWSSYRPLNYYEFPLKYGDLVSLDGIESSQLIGRFVNQTILYNKLNSFSDATTVNNNLLGDGSLFSQRPYEFNTTDIGFSGSQHKAMVSCEFGHFWVDSKRGDVFHLKPNASGKSNITLGLKHWFKEHLPFKILKGSVEGLSALDLDNTYKGLGITLGWDSRFKRLFLTKLDYEIAEDKKGSLRFSEGKFLDGSLEIDFSNEDYFKPCHFTIAYKPEYQSWISYYSFHPNFYNSFDNYFQTGYNNGSGSLWSHLLTNQSYQVFNGIKQPWIVEYALANSMNNSNLNNIHYWLDTKRYSGRYDFSEKRGLGFNKAVVYNKSNNSGNLNLVKAEKNNLFQQTQYPKHNNTSLDILATEDDKKWSFNHTYNLVKDETNNIPIWLNDCNEILKQINIKSVSYTSNWKDRLRGDYFLVRLIQDLKTNFSMTLKWTTDNRNYYEQ